MTSNLPKLGIAQRTPLVLRLVAPFLLLLLATPSLLSAQEAISFDRLKELLDPYFAPELIGDVEAALPKSTFDVWGFDVGDYSGDGFNDLIVSIRVRKEKGNRMRIYHFVDVEGILELIREETAQFVELPIEVGVTIGDGNAYLLVKRDESGWDVWGRRYEDGVIMLVDTYRTDQGDALIHESYRNYQSLSGWERYLRVRNEEEIFRADFLTIPSYMRGRHVSSGFAMTATATLAEHILKGAYYRESEADLLLHVRSAWDREYLYFNVIVDDDEIVPHADGVDSIGDRLEIWIDAYTWGDRLRGGGKRTTFRTVSDSNIYGLMIDLGDLAEVEPDIKVATTNLFDEGQTRATSRIKAIASKHDRGWSVRVRIPFALFGFKEAPVADDALLTLGASVVVHDLDNRWRPDELTQMTTSHNFDRTKPATFGELILVPGSLNYGESRNVFFPQVKERLEEIGF